jgi:hypothetical protein
MEDRRKTGSWRLLVAMALASGITSVPNAAIVLALSFAGLGALTLALNEAPSPWPFASAKFVIVLATGVVLLLAFVLIERRLSEPLVDVRMFGRRNLSGASIVVFVLDFAFRRGPVLHSHLPPGPARLQRAPGRSAAAPLTMMIAMPMLLGGISSSTSYADVWPPLDYTRCASGRR